MSQRPDLSGASSEIRAYIEALEAELASLKHAAPARFSPTPAEVDGDDLENLPTRPASEPETTLCLVTLTASFIAKRTYRHLYLRQRRGGMGIFDLETAESDPPAILAVADEAQSLLLFTNLGRAFRIPLSQIPVGEVRSRGVSIAGKMDLRPGEKLAAALPDLAQGAVALVSRVGMVRYLRHHVFGEYMRPGTVLLDAQKYGELVAACHTPGSADLLIATRQGKAIRFSEKLIPPQGGPGMRLESGDEVVAVASVDDDSSLLLVDAQGNGTIRRMSAFLANKSAGGSGKIAMKTDHLVLASRVSDAEDIFLISRLCKVIRFSAEEIPAKEGVVQGVHCMALRSDWVVAGIATR
jgi:DNA gyrase subunit A